MDIRYTQKPESESSDKPKIRLAPKLTSTAKLTSTGRKQRGVALITAILIVALASIAAAAMFSKQQLNTRRTENMVHSDQAYLYTLGAEQWASQVLLQDSDMKIDHASESWATPLPPIPVDGGSISGFIIDATSGFPLNNLVDANGAHSKYYVAAFKQLTEQLFDNNPGVSNLVLDWLDKNSDVTLGDGIGAEDTEYQNLQDRPFRAANRPMSSASELKLILRLSEDASNLKNDYAALFPRTGPALVNALPIGTKININSAPRVILTSLAMSIGGMDQSTAESIVADTIKDRDKEPITTTNGFKTALRTELEAKLRANAGNTGAAVLPPERIKEIDAVVAMLSVGSEYFLVQSTGKIGRIELQLHSLVKREQNKVTTLRRGLGAL